VLLAVDGNSKNEEMKTGEQKYNWKSRIGLSAFVLFTVYAINFILNPYASVWKELFICNKPELALDLSISFLFCWLIIEASIRIAKWLERFLPWTRSPFLRFVVQTLLIVASTLFLLFVQGQIYEWIFDDMPLTQQELLETWQFFVAVIIVSLFVSAIHTGHYLLNRWKASISEAKDLQLKAMELKEIAMQSELQSLKMQLDPHFMFNNFSTLSELINEDRETATRFLKNLSHVYRYMVQNLKKDIISLSDEVAFVKAYCYLIHIRHADNVQIVFDLNEECLDMYIPPISLQLLVENAIKHNIATQELPLIITIRSNDRQVIKVCNNLQRIPSAFPATGIGLKNITNRYRILSEELLPVIEETSTRFCVTLALLNNN
jgi:two-component system, LytTR family, sensor kinase